MNKVERHMDICNNLNKIYEQKNHDYGDSFHDTFVEEGAAMARIRLSDKLNRFKKLSMTDSEQKVNDESIRDTLLDLANYAIMTVMEMDILAEEDKRVQLGEELSKMKDEWEAARMLNHEKVQAGNFYGKRFGLHLDCRKDVICPRCGNALTFDPEKSSEKNDIYICGRCGTLYLVNIEQDYMIPKTEKELKDPDPCEKCTYPGKVTCRSFGGCVDHVEWEKRQMSAVDVQEEEDKTFQIPENFANSGEYFCPNCGNKLAFNPKIDKYICGGCGIMYNITAK